MERPAERGIDRILLAAVRLSGVDLGQAGILDQAERQLALSFGAGIHRDRFVAGRIALRLHAAAVADVSAGGLRADYLCRECRKDDHVHGMPRYTPRPSGPVVLASLSRAEDWCLLAATADDQVLGVGVDLEASTAAGFAGFNEVALSERERQHLQRAEPALRPGIQTLLWTRKEAVLKALGRGLAVIDPSLVDVAGPLPLLPGFLEPPAVRVAPPDGLSPVRPSKTGVPVVGGQSGSGHHWLVDSVNPDLLGLPDYFTGAVAVLLKRYS
ncbi:4'-phosphopantetheinyl transferase superfamily protein [Arthrobacter sp. OAP107]|uniref:4'-phosphopantetheinyl transferase family protein n=1 Tax=Arthrobacter sp. OAP107 TaxID=3156445 RepID=UPI00339221FA